MLLRHVISGLCGSGLRLMSVESAAFYFIFVSRTLIWNKGEK